MCYLQLFLLTVYCHIKDVEARIATKHMLNQSANQVG